mmetsp:Transcript_116048/g.328387  ORF Transcript_116048/g.328387 Transcript_116048/m.328387 type:complete len:206 (-) Transcript_116048:309-926(-)
MPAAPFAWPAPRWPAAAAPSAAQARRGCGTSVHDYQQRQPRPRLRLPWLSPAGKPALPPLRPRPNPRPPRAHPSAFPSAPRPAGRFVRIFRADPRLAPRPAPPPGPVTPPYASPGASSAPPRASSEGTAPTSRLERVQTAWPFRLPGWRFALEWSRAPRPALPLPQRTGRPSLCPGPAPSRPPPSSARAQRGPLRGLLWRLGLAR